MPYIAGSKIISGRNKQHAAKNKLSLASITKRYPNPVLRLQFLICFPPEKGIGCVQYLFKRQSLQFNAGLTFETQKEGTAVEGNRVLQKGQVRLFHTN